MSEAREWAHEHQKKSLSIKSETPEHYTVANYGVVWGGQDLDQQYFDQDTDLWLGKISETPPVLYDHGQDEGPGKTIVGRVIKTVPDDIGLWVEAQIDKAGKYAEAIRELVRKGLIGFSSGAPNYLIDVAPDGKILSWPIVEFSLTPWPAEPRTIGVIEMRSLADLQPAIKSILPKEELTVELTVEDGQRIIRFQGV